MKKLLSLILAAMMLLSVTSFAVAEDKQVLTVVTWDAKPPLPDRSGSCLRGCLPQH